MKKATATETAKDNFLQDLENVPTGEQTAPASNVSTEKQIETLNEQADLVTYGQNIKSVDEMLDAAENIADEYFDDATSEYLKLNKGDKATLLFVGFGKMKNDKGEDVETAIFTGKENKKFIHAGAVIVGSLKRAENLPCFVRLTHNGSVKGKNGKEYADIRVQILKDIKQA